MNSVGNLLKEKRESMDLSIDDIASKTRVQKKYIEAIEAGDFSFFQGQSFYQQVFIGSYADIVGVNKNELLEQLAHDKEEFEVFSKKSPVASKNYELEQAKELEVVEKPIADEVVIEESEAEVEEVFVQPDLTSEEVAIEEDIFTQPEITTEEINVVEDAPTIIDSVSDENQIEEVVVEEVEEAKSPYPVPKIFDKYLQDVDVDTLIANEKANQEEIAAEEEIEPEDITIDNIFQEEVSEESLSDDITKLIDELSQDFSGELESDLNVDLSKAQPLEEDEIDVETLNSSILDDIKKLSDETTIDEAFEQKVIDSIDYEVKNQSIYTKEPAIESTAVIDITSGIELEKIPAQRVEATIEDEEVNLNQDDLFNETVEDEVIESTITQEKLIKELENTLENKDLFDNLQDSINPDKTSMDLKVAQALGDAKESVTEEIEKEKKRLSTLDYLLIIVFIILVIVLGYIAFQYLNLG